jgi:cob(I)alamin adenosyltransferase
MLKMVEDKKEKLRAELEKYEKKVFQLKKDCAEFKAGGSRYGDEYGEMQIKVYGEMMAAVKEELRKLERKT